MILSITGSRSIIDYIFCENEINKIIIAYDKIISGGALGVDTIAKEYAINNNIPFIEYKPDWQRYKKSAGFIRNIDILKNANFNLIIWDKKSPGTKFNIDYCKKHDLPYKLVLY
jgi:hypothetical protein